MRNKSLSFAVYVPKHNGRQDFSIRERQSCSQHFSQLTRDDMCQLSDLQTVDAMWKSRWCSASVNVRWLSFSTVSLIQIISAQTIM